MKQELKISCRKECLSDIRAFVNESLAHLDISDSLLYKIVLAVDEACSNAIIHGNNCDESKEINVELEVIEQILKVKIFDIGEYTQNYKEVGAISLEDHINNKDKGGLGLKLILSIMDEVEFYTKNHLNICQLAKELA